MSDEDDTPRWERPDDPLWAGRRERPEEREPEEERRRREEPRHLARVREPLDVLLRDEAEGPDEGERPRRAAAEAAFLERKPDEADRREDREHLRPVLEVAVDRAGSSSGQPIGEGVGDEDARRGHRSDEPPREHAPCHYAG